MALADALGNAGGEVETAFASYESTRPRIGSAVVEHARALGAYLGGDRSEDARRRHTADAVMREIAVTRSFTAVSGSPG
jgi:hypothetical protein